MIIDPVVESLHKQREEYMERFQFDFDAVVRELRAHEAASPALLLEPPVSSPSESAVHRARLARR